MAYIFGGQSFEIIKKIFLTYMNKKHTANPFPVMYVCMYRVFIASFVYGQMLVRKIVDRYVNVFI